MPTIVMTGATSGIGRIAAGLLLRQPGMRLIVGVRRQGTAPTGAEERPLDLASLASVRSFAASLAGLPIDTLILNAGGQRPEVAARSVDGLELTFATNHLAHLLALHLLAPQISARVIITSSGTHDPHERTGVPPPRHINAARLANPDLDPDLDASAFTAGMRAYSTSKLANLMTARHFARHHPHIATIAYDPGLTPGTGLVRHQHWAVRGLVWPLLPLLTRIRPGMNSLAAAGAALADLAGAAPPPGQVYASLRKGRLIWPAPSRLAADDALAEKLWADSLALVALRSDPA